MKKYMYGIGLMILLVLTLFILPVWNVKAIQLVGNDYYMEDDILRMMSFQSGMHILKLNSQKSVQEISQLPYIKSVDVAYTFPNKVSVTIAERRPMGYVKFLDAYLCIDEEGYVIEESSQKRLQLPEIEGLSFTQFVVGEKLPLTYHEQLAVVREMVTILNKYEFTEQVDSIQVSNINQIHLYVNRLNVIIGNIRDFDKKVKYLIEVHKQYAMGILDLSMVEHKQAILKPMN